ncbi:MAG: hypothetical protein ACYCSN_07195 [Acidobacteriaceae bacterium]
MLLLHRRKAWHSPFAVMDEVGNLLISHMAFYAKQGRKPRQVALSLLAMADSAIVRINLCADRIANTGDRRLACSIPCASRCSSGGRCIKGNIPSLRDKKAARCNPERKNNQLFHGRKTILINLWNPFRARSITGEGEIEAGNPF